MRWQPAASALPSVLGGGGIGATEDPDGNNSERIWVDFLAKYLIKKETYSNPKIYGQIQNGSVFWGCPAFNTALFEPTATYPSLAEGTKRYSMSYGMSRASLGPYKNTIYTDAAATPTAAAPVIINGTTYSLSNIADISTVKGQFFKMEQWGRKGQGKGLVADSNGFNIHTSQNWSRADEAKPAPNNAKTEPAFMGIDYPMAGITGSYVMIDATRHLGQTANTVKIHQSRGANMLFVDGHAAPVTPREAWIAMWGGGIDSTGP